MASAALGTLIATVLASSADGALLAVTIPHGAPLGPLDLSVTSPSGVSAGASAVLTVTEITVSQSGNDTDLGSTHSPVHTLDKALALNGGASKGDQVVVLGIVEVDSAEALSVAPGVTLRGVNGTVHPGPLAITAFQLNDGDLVEDLTIENFIYDGLTSADGAAVTIHNCALKGMGYHGVNMGGTALWHIYGDDPSKCIFSGNANQDIYVFSGGEQVGLRIENCTLSDSKTDGIRVEGDGQVVGSNVAFLRHPNSGLYVQGGASATFTDSTFDSAGASAVTSGFSDANHVELHGGYIRLSNLAGVDASSGTVVIDGTEIYGHTNGEGIATRGAAVVTCTDCDLHDNAVGLIVEEQVVFTFAGGRIVNSTKEGVLVIGGASLSITTDGAGKGAEITKSGTRGVSLTSCIPVQIASASIHDNGLFGIDLACTNTPPDGATFRLQSCDIEHNPVGLNVGAILEPISIASGTFAHQQRQAIAWSGGALGGAVQGVAFLDDGSLSAGSSRYPDIDDERTEAGSPIVLDSTTTWEGQTASQLGVTSGEHHCGATTPTCPSDGSLVMSQGGPQRPIFRVGTTSARVTTE